MFRRGSGAGIVYERRQRVSHLYAQIEGVAAWLNGEKIESAVKTVKKKSRPTTVSFGRTEIPSSIARYALEEMDGFAFHFAVKGEATPSHGCANKNIIYIRMNERIPAVPTFRPSRI